MSADTRAVLGVLSRIVGEPCSRFNLRLVAAQGADEFFQLSAISGQVTVLASSTSALCRGAYHYLKQACHAQVTWSGGQIELPPSLPDFAPEHIVCPNRLRYYLSVCTFGYSTAWWDWLRWEREIDWMALHGINMPLALVGQELVWQRVFRKLGLEEWEIESHFSGPAYLPWNRLGNLNGYMGPLPQTWIDDQAELHRKVLDRERELGMMPVVPGFSGFVPAGFRRLHPEVELHTAEPWAGFQPTTFVDPRNPIFAEIGRLFIEEYRKEFGAVHHYICETFAEQLPIDADLEFLRSVGKATWEGMVSADPECVWVMQGWPFSFGRRFWTPDKAEALFDCVPRGRLIVLDQATEELEIWREQPAVREKGWVHSVVHNYGAATHLHGDLGAFGETGWAATQSPDRGSMLGMGIVPEGIDQNPIVYEFLTDRMWSGIPPEPTTWVRDYVRSRYGASPASAMAAWDLLLESVYGAPSPPTLRYCWRYRPGDQPIVTGLDAQKLAVATRTLADSSKKLCANTNFQRDLVDVAKTWLGSLADLVLDEALAALGSGDSRYSSLRDRFFGLLLALDRLLAALPEHRISTWVSAARSAGTTEDEANLYEANARSLITHWGGSFLFDYATKEWSGLTEAFHLERWRMYFEYLEGKRHPAPDFATWELGWATVQPAHPLRADVAGVKVELLPRPSEESADVTLDILPRPCDESADVTLEILPRPWGERAGVRGTPTEVVPGAENPIEVVAELLQTYSDLGPIPPQAKPTIHGPMAATKSEPATHWMTLLLSLQNPQSLAGVAIFPIFGQGFRARYSIDVSPDGARWTRVLHADVATCRGARQAFSSIVTRHIRFKIERDLGDPTQLFKVLTFEAV